MLKFLALFLSVSVVSVVSQNWQSGSYVLNANDFFTNLLQETMNELEHREWCNLKMDNIYQTISDSLYNFLVNGTVMYHNGFLVSIQKINLVNLQNSLSSSTSDGITTTFATVRGNLNLNDVTVGYDVEANLNNNGVESVHKFTGTYNHILIQYQISIQKNLNTGEVLAFSSLLNLGAGSGVRMIYMPSNNITEALSRRWIPGNNFNAVALWGSAQMVPIINNLISTRIPFPDICIGCYL